MNSKIATQRFWLRMGDMGEYQDFDSIGEVAYYLVEAGITSDEIRQVSGRSGITARGFQGNNYISLYTGDKDANMIHSLSGNEFGRLRLEMQSQEKYASKYASRISRIAKKVVGYDINDIRNALEEYGGSAVVAGKAMTEAARALARNDVNGAFEALSRLSPRAKQAVPSHVMEWLEQNSGKTLPREGWKVQVSRSIEQVFGKGLNVDWEYSSFLTYTEGTSNKFHFFAVVKTEDGEYVGGNAYGRIGANAKIIEIARSLSLNSVMSVVRQKEYQKEAKGYRRS